MISLISFRRAEVERVRCGLLGDGVSGRANVISDKEFRDKNKVLTTSNQQKHGEAISMLSSLDFGSMHCGKRAQFHQILSRGRL